MYGLDPLYRQRRWPSRRRARGGRIARLGSACGWAARARRSGPLERAEWIARLAAAGAATGMVVMALGGIWQGTHQPLGRAVGRPYTRLPWWLLGGFSALYVLLLVRLWRPLPVRLAPPARAAVLAAGVALYAGGLALIAAGRCALGSMYNVSSALGAQLYAGHRLVTTGPFAVVRHPMYAGALAWAVGAVLLYRTWAVLLILAHMPVLWVRARREEAVLAREFGESWQAYRRQVPSGVPGL